MRKPLAPLQAFAEDARLAAERGADVDDGLVSWMSIAQAAEALTSADPAERERAMAQAEPLLAAYASTRPTMVHDAQPAPDEPLDVLVERFRVAVETMERAGCFELAYSTMSALCRLTASANYVTSALATLHLGRVARQMNDLPVAEDCYTSMLTACARERDGPLAARGHIGIALLHDMRGNMPAAEAEYRRALALAVRNGHTAVQACTGLMTMAIQRGRLADALLYGWQRYDATEQLFDERSAALSDLAAVALKAGFTDAALSGFEHAMTLSQVPRLHMTAASGAARASARLGIFDRLTRYDAVTRTDIGRTHAPFESSFVYLCLAEAWATAGDYALAHERLTEARSLADRYHFHEYRFRADALEASWTSSATPGDAGDPWVDAPPVFGSREDPTIDAGIRRFEVLAS